MRKGTSYGIRPFLLAPIRLGGKVHSLQPGTIIDVRVAVFIVPTCLCGFEVTYVFIRTGLVLPLELQGGQAGIHHQMIDMPMRMTRMCSQRVHEAISYLRCKPLGTKQLPKISPAAFSVPSSKVDAQSQFFEAEIPAAVVGPVFMKA